MTPLHQVLARLLRKLRLIGVPHLFEARCAWLLEPEIHNFVLGAEGAAFDAGLIIADGDRLPKDSTARLFTALHRFQGQKVLLPIDMKTFHPCPAAIYKGSLYHYSLSISEAQYDAAALLFCNSATPDWLALVPTQFLFDERGSAAPFSSGGSNCTDAEPDPFPVMMYPYVFPKRLLKQAVLALEACALDPQTPWRNPWNDLEFPLRRPLPLHPVDTLRPAEASDLQDLSTVADLWKAFNNHSSSYKTQRLMIQPSVGDLCIVHQLTGATSTIEIKERLMQLSPSGDVSFPMVPASWSNRIKLRLRVFSPFTSWDMLLAPLAGDDHRAILVPQDQLPDWWFTEKVTRGNSHSFRASAEWIQLHVISWDWSNPLQVVQDMEKLLDHYRASTQGLCRNITRPIIASSAEDCLSLLYESPDVAESGDDTVNEVRETTNAIDIGENDNSEPEGPEYARLSAQAVDRPLRGSGIRWSWRQYNAAQQIWLQRQCVDEDYGAVFGFNDYLSATHVFAPGQWKDSRPPPMISLSPNTDTLLLNIVQVAFSESRLPRDKKRPKTFFPATHGQLPSLYILKPYPPEFEEYNPYVFIVPSVVLASDEGRSKLNESIMQHGWHSFTQGYRSSMVIKLPNGQTYYAYQERSQNVVKALRKIYWQIAELPTDNMKHIIDVRAVSKINLDDYVVQLRDLLRQIDQGAQQRVVGRIQSNDGDQNSDSCTDDEQGEEEEEDDDDDDDGDYDE